MLDTPAGRSAGVLNVTSDENFLFDLMFERLLQAPHTFERALGAGLRRGRADWVDLKIDCRHTLRHLDRLGFRVLPPVNTICHWSGYMRPGLFPLYSALLRERGRYPLSVLRVPVAGGKAGGAKGRGGLHTQTLTA